MLVYDRALYLQLAKEGGLPIISTNHSFDEVQSKIEKEIMELLK